MQFTQPISVLIQKRYSVRHYVSRPLSPNDQQALRQALASLTQGPLGSRVRLNLVAANENDREALRGLGTYGFIRAAPAFIAGAVDAAPYALEDYGYLMELAILKATEMNLGTCWLGGTFAYSNFAKKIDLQTGETLPAVTATGYIPEKPSLVSEVMRQVIGAKKRQPWESLFFDHNFQQPLSPQAAGPYAGPLEMVRLAPSASNKQPWRILRQGSQWHFFLQRDRAYTQPQGMTAAMIHADIQRLDMGIAMCHFEQTAHSLGFTGAWQSTPPAFSLPVPADYIQTWIEG